MMQDNRGVTENTNCLIMMILQNNLLDFVADYILLGILGT